MEKWTLTHFVKKICCVSSDLNKHIVKELGQGHSEKILTIPNWIYPVRNRVIRSRELEGLNNYRKIKIIAVGRLVKEKGYDILIEALYNIINKGIKLYCDIFGDGPEKKNLIFQIIKYNLSNFIKLKGVSSNIRKVIPKYDFLVIPSREESFGLIVLEAYDAGIPVIASNTFGLREIVLNEKTGLFFEPNNAKSLAFQIIKLVNSPKLKISLAKNARQYVKNFYPNRDLLNKYIEFYEIKF